MLVSQGSYTYKASRATYEGDWLKGFRHGFGRIVFQDGTYYEGDWYLGEATGEGTIVYNSGRQYSG